MHLRYDLPYPLRVVCWVTFLTIDHLFKYLTLQYGLKMPTLARYYTGACAIAQESAVQSLCISEAHR